jgi:hypothetical protein
MTAFPEFRNGIFFLLYVKIMPQWLPFLNRIFYYVYDLNNI